MKARRAFLKAALTRFYFKKKYKKAYKEEIAKMNGKCILVQYRKVTIRL